MKSLKYIIISLILTYTANTRACWHPVYTPGEYFVFYSYDKNVQNDIPSTTELNIMEWQSYVQDLATYQDIYDVVYRYSIEDMVRIGNVSSGTGDSLYRNSFVRYLVDTHDKEAIDYLVLAKICEQRRSVRSDKWWYPTKDDLKFEDLKDILDRALAHKGSKLHVRYMLQAMRAAYSMGEYDLCLQLWNDEIKDNPPSSVRTMCEDYVGGIYFHYGDYTTAIRHYANTMQSSSSFWWCASQLTESNTDIEKIKILYEYCPNSPELAVMVQKICREAENRANPMVFDGREQGTDCFEDDCEYKTYLENRQRYITLRDFALEAASGKSDQPDMWLYTASFLTLLDGDPEMASRYLSKAAKANGTPFIKNNVRILQMMTDAMTGKYNSAFENRMLAGMKWLDKMIEDNMTDEVKQDYTWYEHSVFYNYSMYYYHDMMRKITLSIMVPRYLARGEETKALLLSGMVSERLRTITGYRDEQKDDDWNIDFYTDVFSMIDTLSVEGVIGYRDILNKGGRNAFEKFLVSKCYKDNDYLNEIIGTKYMRTEQFDKAIEYLSLVTEDYATRLNTYAYYHYDPFQEPFIRRKYIAPDPAYKLSFATRMIDLREIARIAKNQEIKAEATYRYALGLMRATSDCWALLRYKNGWMFKSDKFSEWGTQLTDHYSNLCHDAAALTTDRELNARILAAQMWVAGDDRYYYDFEGDRWTMINNPRSRYKEIYELLTTSYSNTDIHYRLSTECDLLFWYENNE